jgi:outer membrane biosynthesis protein TonB
MAMWKTITGVAVLSLVFGGGPTRAQTHVPPAGQGDRGDPLAAPENPSKSADKTNKQKPATSPKSPQLKAALPMVASASVPLYPPLARVANVEGVVHVSVTTDGHRVTSAHAEDGPKLLATAAEDNARTWQFAVHDPTTFTVTYTYALPTEWKSDPNNPIVVLRLPTEVQVSAVHFHTQ